MGWCGLGEVQGLEGAQRRLEGSELLTYLLMQAAGGSAVKGGVAGGEGWVDMHNHK